MINEYQQRLSNVRDYMQKRGLEVLLTADPANMHYLSGYDGWSFYVPQCLIIGIKENTPPVWWGRGIDHAGAKQTVWMSEEYLFSYGDEYIHNPPHHAGEHLAQTLAGLFSAGSIGTVGYESDCFYFTPATLEALQKGLPQAKFITADNIINWQRAQKSESELQLLRKAAKIVENMHRCALEITAVGVPKNIIAAEISQAAIAGVDGLWGDYPAMVPMLPAGKQAACPHLTWDDTPLTVGEGMFFELSGCYLRYNCPLARTIYLGNPPKIWRSAEEALLEALADGIATARPGAVCGDVARATNAALARHGFKKSGRCGYSIGIGYPPDWGEKTMSFRPQDESEIKPGMTFHFMPGLWLDDWGIEITESIEITASGAKPLANYPRKLFVKD